MPIEVLLLDKVEKLGVEGDVVKVADGYARNYLLPRGLAGPVTEGQKRKIAKRRQERLAMMKRELDGARKLADDMVDVSCTIAVKVADKKSLYGSVKRSQVAEKLQEQGFAINKKQVLLEEPIKELGFYDLKIELHPEVDVSVRVNVVDENE